MDTPKLVGTETSWVYHDPQTGVEIRLYRCRLHSDGRLTAFLRFYSHQYGGLRIAGSGQVNLAAPLTRSRLAKELELAHPLGGVWNKLLDDLYLALEEKLLDSSPAQHIVAEGEPKPLPYVVYPFLPKHLPTIFYGLGGQGKGWLALILAKAVIAGQAPQGLDCEVQERGPVIYLDWESCEDEFRSRWARVAGADTPDPIVYRRCTSPLRSDLDYISSLVVQVQPKLLIIDSAGLAAGGDLTLPTAPVDLFAAIRTLKTTALLIAHAPKHSPAQVYGSVYFANLARSVWEVRAELEKNSNSLILGIEHKKSNISPLQQSYGLGITFSYPLSTWRADLASSSLASMVGPTARVLEALEGGPRTVRQLVSETGLSEPEVRAALLRLRSRDRVYLEGDGRWARPELTFPGA